MLAVEQWFHLVAHRAWRGVDGCGHKCSQAGWSWVQSELHCGGEHRGDGACLSCAAAVRLPVPAASRLVEALWSPLGRAQDLEYASFKASSLPAAETPSWGWPCDPGLQLSVFSGAGGQMGLYPSCGSQWCLILSPNIAACPRGIPPGGLLRTSSCMLALFLLVEHTAVFLWAMSLAGLPSLCSPALLGTRPTASGSAVCVCRQPLPGSLQTGVG